MAKEDLKDPPTSENDVTEIIELCTNDIEALARAFNLIADVCENRESPALQLDSAPRALLN
jgi:hypothetical protein